MPAGSHKSIKKEDTYQALRDKGYSKEKAARIANAQANHTIDYHHDGPAVAKSKARKKKT